MALSLSPMGLALDVARLQNGVHMYGETCGSRDSSPARAYMRKNRELLTDQTPEWMQVLEWRPGSRLTFAIVALFDCLPLKSSFNFAYLKTGLRRMIRKCTLGALDGIVSLTSHHEISLLLASFTVWKHCLAESRQKKEMESLQEVIQKILGRTLQVIVGGQGKQMMLKAFPAWKDFWILTRSEKQRKDQSMTSARLLLGQQEGVMQRMCFCEWGYACAQMRQAQRAEVLEKEWKHQFDQTMKKKTQESSYKAVANMVAGNDKLLSQSFFGLWKELWTEARMERVKKESAQRTAMSMFGSSEKVCIQATLMAWKDEWIHACKHHELERLKQQMENEKSALEKQMEQERKDMKANAAEKTALALFGAQGEVLMGTTFKLWKDLVGLAKQERQVQAMQKQMDCMKESKTDAAKKVALKLLAQDAAAWVKTGFQAWRDSYLEDRQLREVGRLQEAMQRAESKANEGMQRAAKRLFGTQEAVFLRNVYSSWKEAWAEAVQERLVEKFQKDMGKKLRNQQYAYQAKAAANLASSQTGVLQQSAFSLWKEIWTEADKARKVQELHRQVSQAKIDAAQRTALKMFGSQEGALLQAIWASWRDFYLEVVRQREIENMQQEMRQMKSADAKKAAISLFQAQDGMLIQSTFMGWHQVIFNIRQERDVQRVKDDLDQVRAMGEANARRAAMRLLATDAVAWYKTGFQAWRDLWLEERQRREVIKLQNLVSNAESKAQEGMKRAATRLFGNQEGIFIRSVIGSWRDLCLENRAAQEAERMQAQMRAMADQQRRKSLFHSQRAAHNMISGQTTLLLQSVFQTWRDARLEALQQRKMEDLERELSQNKLQAAQRTAMNMFGSQLSVLKQAGFQGWRDLWTQSKMQSQVRQMQEQMQQEMRQQQLQSAHSTMMTLIGSQAEMLFRTVFQTWRDDWIESVNLRKSQELEKKMSQMEASQKSNAQQVAMRLLASDANTWMKTTWTHWRDLWQEQKTQREMEYLRITIKKAEAKAEEGMHRAALRLFGNQSDVMLRTVTSAWRDHWVESKQSIEAEKLREQMMASLKQQSREFSSRAAANLISNSASALCSAVFSEWKDIIFAEIRDREMEALRAQVSQTKMESAHRVAMNLFGAQQGGLLQAAFGGWKDLWVEFVRQKQMIAMQKELKTVKMDGAQKAALALFGAQSDLVVKTTYGCWRDVLYEEKTNRAASAMQRELALMREKSNQGAHKAAQKLLASNDEVWVRTCYSGWRDLWITARQEAAKEALQREIKQKEAKAEESMRRAAMRLFGSQEDVLMRMMFTEWEGMWREESQSRLVHRLKQEMVSSMRRRSLESSTRAAANLASSQMSLVMQSTFTSWKETMLEERTARERMQQKMEVAYETALKLMGNQKQSLLYSSMLAWRDAWIDAVREREVLSLRKEMRAKNSMTTIKSAMAVVDSKSEVLRQMAFIEWASWIKQTSKERELLVLRKDLERMKSQSEQNAHKAALRFFTGTVEVAFHSSFVAWKELVMVHRQQNFMESLQCDVSQQRLKSAYKTAMSLMSSMGNVMTQGIFAAWREHWSRCRKLQLEFDQKAEIRHAQKESIKRSTETMLDMQSRLMTSVICRMWKDWVEVDQDKREVYGLQQDVLRLREDLQNCAVKLLEGPQVELPRFVALMVAFSDMCCLIIEGSVF